MLDDDENLKNADIDVLWGVLERVVKKQRVALKPRRTTGCDVLLREERPATLFVEALELFLIYRPNMEYACGTDQGMAQGLRN